MTEPSVPKHRWLVPLFFAACLLVYPNRLLLFAPHWIIFAFSTASVTLLAIGFILLSGRAAHTVRTLPRYFSGGMIVFVLIAAWHALTHSGQYKLNDFALSVSYISIPLFACAFREELKRHLPVAMTVFWSFTILQSLTERILLDTNILSGLPMNINWNASLIAVTLPFVIYLILTKTTGILWRALWISIAALLSAYVLWICFSNAVFLAVPCAGIFCGIMYYGKNFSQKIMFLLIALLLAIGGMWLYLLICKPEVDSIDRIFFYRNTLKVIGDAPFFGHGIPSFAQAFLPYRTEEYFALQHAAEHVNHPHNHFLFIAAGVGLVGLLAWLTLIFVPYFKFAFCKFKEAAIMEKLVFFSFSLLLLHSMVDLVLFQVPTNLLAFLFLGMIWGCLAREDLQTDAQAVARIPMIAGWFVAFIALIMACANLYASIHYRIGYRSAEKDPAKASVHLAHAVMFSSWDNQLYYQYPIANFYIKHKMFDDAHYMLSLIENSPEPDYAHIHLLRGRIYQQQKKYDQAVKEFIKEAELYPLHPEPVLRIWSIADQHGQAQVCREAAIELNRRFEILQWDIHFDPENLKNITGSDLEILMPDTISDHKKIFRRLREINP